MSAIPPATLEGWYTLHQMFSLDWRGLSEVGESGARAALEEFSTLLEELTTPDGEGWSAAFQVIGLSLIHI